MKTRPEHGNITAREMLRTMVEAIDNGELGEGTNILVPVPVPGFGNR